MIREPVSWLSSWYRYRLREEIAGRPNSTRGRSFDEFVAEWLEEEGIARGRMRLSASKGWIEVNATVAEAERILDTEYHVYTHPSGAEQISE